MVVRLTHPEAVILEDARIFAREHRIAENVEEAIRAARDVYTNGEPITAELKRDPEFGDWYVDVHVTLHDEEEPETAAQKDEACILKWAPQVAPDLRGLLHFSSSWAS